MLFRPLLAHAFGQVYTLPVPLWLYLYAAAATVVVSFVVVGYFVDRTPADKTSRAFNVSKSWWHVLGALNCALGILTLLAGLYGSQSPTDNFSVTFFWVIFLLGTFYLSAIFGEFWPLVNPWRYLMLGLRGLGLNLNGRRHLPDNWRHVIPLVLFGGLVWLELLSQGWGIVPAHISQLIAAYTLLTLAGAWIFGLDDWFSYGDLWTTYFGLAAKISPLTIEPTRVTVRRPLQKLWENWSVSPALVILIIFTLSATAFDGWRETASYFSVFSQLHQWTGWGIGVLEIILMLAALAAFCLVYGLFIAIMRLVIKDTAGWYLRVRQFAPSLLPIAVAYNAAHYYALLVIQGQAVLRQLSDPLNRGWDLLGTASWRINAGVLQANTVWYTQVILIVAGHVAAVYVAHLIALRLYRKPSKALLSQYPILFLMVIYTMTSLWIIAQPITRQ